MAISIAALDLDRLGEPDVHLSLLWRLRLADEPWKQRLHERRGST